MVPALSIITVNLNNAEGLKRTIESVVCQSYTDYEYLIIDGGSIDKSKDIIQQYASNISYWVSENDNGIYNAMNKGITTAKGKYLLFLNSGDSLYNSKVLEKIFRKDYNNDIIYGNMMIHYINGKKRVGIMPHQINNTQLINDTLWHPVSFISKKLFEQNGNFNEEYRIVGDYEFFARVFSKNKISAVHAGIIISDFYADGLSYLQENKKTVEEERNRVQQIYFKKEEILKARKRKINDSKLPARIINKFHQLLARLA